MISKCIRTLVHMSCQCGRHPSLMQSNLRGTTGYHVESLCCRTQTVLLSTPDRAINEYQRLRGVQYEDTAHTAAPVPQNVQNIRAGRALP